MIYLLPEGTPLCRGGWKGRNPGPGGDRGSCPGRLLLPLPLAAGSPLSLSVGYHNFGAGLNTDGIQWYTPPIPSYAYSA